MCARACQRVTQTEKDKLRWKCMSICGRDRERAKSLEADTWGRRWGETVCK